MTTIQELKELSALACRDTTQENRDFWKNEMAQALRDIQAEYDSKLDSLKNDLDGVYATKVQEIRNNSARGNLELNQLRDDNARIKNQLVDLRKRLPDLEARNAQLERQLNDAKQDLDENAREVEVERSGLKKDLMTAQQELERTLVEFNALLDAKLSLELEIAAYRKLLESEENRYATRSNRQFSHPKSPGL
ncbi:hypothetical protein Ciccas_012241 [Cichlidogyrus casuarinus]|uniref:IF rod domain-containing protein n=1 Tax=Cichlidogyrus casuarinus TaxID=1844966 RepID=A0ABD2PQC6_9PLAT